MTTFRAARVDDYWRTQKKRNYNLELEEITFSGKGFLTGLQLSPKKGINAIVGKNGVGKSNLIRGLYNIFFQESSNRNPYELPLLSNTEISVVLKVNGKKTTVKGHPKRPPSTEHEITGVMFDPCNLIPDLQTLFRNPKNLNELLEGYNEEVFTDEQLQLFNYISNSSYKNASVTLIEDTYDDFPVAPYFKVNNGSCSYDSTTMGLGELSLAYLSWILAYITKLDEQKVLFIEEPESFIPPIAQERLADTLALTASASGIPIIVSSHSEHVIKRISRENIHIVRSTENQSDCSSAEAALEPFLILGLSAPKKGILCVEDPCAEIFLKELIKRSPLFVRDSFLYKISGSESKLHQSINELSDSWSDFRVVGVFDGDSKSRPLQFTSNNYCFLPSTRAPDQLLLDFAKSLTPTQIASYLHTPLSTTRSAIELAEGSDHHDFFHIFSRQIGINYESVIASLFSYWISQDENAPLVNDFLNSLNSALLNQPA